MADDTHTRHWVRRHTRITRVTHWIWAISLFFLFLTGLQIFNAHPVLYVGDQSGFAFDNRLMTIGGADGSGYVEVTGVQLPTTGVLGWSGGQARAFPGWATIPSGTDLATGRVIHFFFAWILVGTLLIWLLGGLWSGHILRDLYLWPAHWRSLWADIRAHIRLRFHHTPRYGPLQRLAYGLVLFVLFPLIIATGLTMSPGINAAMPWLAELFWGRQTARTLHFLAAFALFAFFIVHMAMVLLAGPLNEMRAIVTGWYRADEKETEDA